MSEWDTERDGDGKENVYTSIFRYVFSMHTILIWSINMSYTEHILYITQKYIITYNLPYKIQYFANETSKEK